MLLAVAFGAALIVAVLLSSLAHRSVMSLPLLVVGVVIGSGGLEAVSLGAEGGLVGQRAEIALFTVLFTDGTRAVVPVREGAVLWRPPVRALLIGIPLTAAIVALLTWALTDLPLAAALLGVVLSPTDPVLVSAFVRREDVPQSLRHTLTWKAGSTTGSRRRAWWCSLPRWALEVCAIVALAVALSVVVHTSTDVPVNQPH